MDHSRIALVLGRVLTPFALLIVGGLPSGGCASAADELVGTWRRTDGARETITFRADGTMQVDTTGAQFVGPGAGCVETTTRAGRHTVATSDSGANHLTLDEDDEATVTETACADPANNHGPTIENVPLSPPHDTATFTVDADTLRIVHVPLIGVSTYERQ